MVPPLADRNNLPSAPTLKIPRLTVSFASFRLLNASITNTRRYHQFELAELERVAPGLDAGSSDNAAPIHRRSSVVESRGRFVTGLILALAWRNPLRGRNWCEAILGVQREVCRRAMATGGLRGEDLKTGKRGSDINRL